MSVIQSILVALFCVLGSVCTPLYGFTGGWYILSRPLIGGLICGIITGDVTSGVLMGVAIQAAFLVLVTPGGSFSAELGFISYPMIAVAIYSNMDKNLAVAFATVIGILGTFVLSFTMSINSKFSSMSDKAINKGDVRGVTNSFLIYPQLLQLATRGIPAFLMVYFGSRYIQPLLNSLPAWVITGLTFLGGILPAVGIAAFLSQTVRNKAFLLFFLVGFVCCSALKLDIISITVIACLIGFFYLRTSVAKTASDTNRDMIDDEVL